MSQLKNQTNYKDKIKKLRKIIKMNFKAII